MPLSFIPEKARVLTALTSPELGAFEPSFLEPNENVVEAKEKVSVPWKLVSEV